MKLMPNLSAQRGFVHLLLAIVLVGVVIFGAVTGLNFIKQKPQVQGVETPQRIGSGSATVALPSNPATGSAEEVSELGSNTDLLDDLDVQLRALDSLTESIVGSDSATPSPVATAQPSPDPITTNQVKKGELRVKFKDVDLASSLPVIVDEQTNQIIVITSSGQKQLQVTPVDAVQKLSELGVTNNSPLQLVSGGAGALVYKVNGYSGGKLLGVLPIYASAQAEVGAQTGNVDKLEQPGWFKLLSPLIYK